MPIIVHLITTVIVRVVYAILGHLPSFPFRVKGGWYTTSKLAGNYKFEWDILEHGCAVMSGTGRLQDALIWISFTTNPKYTTMNIFSDDVKEAIVSEIKNTPNYVLTGLMALQDFDIRFTPGKVQHIGVLNRYADVLGEDAEKIYLDGVGTTGYHLGEWVNDFSRTFVNEYSNMMKIVKGRIQFWIHLVTLILSTGISLIVLPTILTFFNFDTPEAIMSRWFILNLFFWFALPYTIVLWSELKFLKKRKPLLHRMGFTSFLTDNNIRVHIAL